MFIDFDKIFSRTPEQNYNEEIKIVKNICLPLKACTICKHSYYKKAMEIGYENTVIHCKLDNKPCILRDTCDKWELDERYR